MVNNDLVIAIKNALERGQHIEQAVISLVNAGYPREEVEEASRQVHMLVQPNRQLQLPSIPINQQAMDKSTKKIITRIIILGVIAAALITFLVVYLV
ncbi:hypothetical protein J4433_00640 [Candidatus Pacearchaeota archaeon]|nr:hypothetical protein [Candidatus Pacearchaeota archaeon]